jgi:ankyrin repeat protein
MMAISPLLHQNENVIVNVSGDTANNTSSSRSRSNSSAQAQHQQGGNITMMCQQQDHMTSTLLQYCERHEWSSVIARLRTHSCSQHQQEEDGDASGNASEHASASISQEAREAREVNAHDRRTPLHMACASSSQHADPFTIASLCLLFPAALHQRDSRGMTPLHCACRTLNPSLDTVRVLLKLDQMLLLQGQGKGQGQGGAQSEKGNTTVCTQVTGTDSCSVLLMQDLEGDTPLHSACRAGASIPVLQFLVESCPAALFVRDHTSTRTTTSASARALTPLERLWLRLTELHGAAKIQETMEQGTHTWDIKETWEAAKLFLNAMTTCRNRPSSSPSQQVKAKAYTLPLTLPFNVVQAIIACDGPREMLQVALTLHPEQALWKNHAGQNALDLAIVCSSGSSSGSSSVRGHQHEHQHQSPIVSLLSSASVIDILLYHDQIGTSTTSSNGSNGARLSGALFQSTKHSAKKKHGTSPLHNALRHGKGWKDGVCSIVGVDAAAASQLDQVTSLYPFMMAACTCFCCDCGANANSNSNTSHGNPSCSCKGNTNANDEECQRLTTIYELLRRSPEQVRLGLGLADITGGCCGITRISSGRKRRAAPFAICHEYVNVAKRRY